MSNAILRLGGALASITALLAGKVNAEELAAINTEIQAIKDDEAADDARDAANLAGDTSLAERVAALEGSSSVPLANVVSRLEVIEGILELTPAGATGSVGAGIGASTEQALGFVTPESAGTNESQG